MTTATQTKPERRQQASALIDELVNERRQVWALYFRIAELKPFTDTEQVEEAVKDFSQLLIDYLSLGHFGIYRRILEGRERRRAILEVAEKIYPEFSGTTDDAVSFNDKYEHPAGSLYAQELEKDLSRLGERLARRFEMEDQLCSLILR